MEEQNQFTPIKKLKCPLTPYQLFTPVSTVFLDNLTQEEQLLGLYKLYNEFVEQFNQIIPVINVLQEWVTKLPEELDAMKAMISALQTQLLKAIETLSTAIYNGDASTLAAAKQYTDKEIAKIPQGGGGEASFGITATEYDSAEITAGAYDSLSITAKEYDTRGRIIFFGDMSTVYLDFHASVVADALETVFNLRDPPIIFNRAYQIEISLGNFSLDAGAPAHLEIVGANTLGNTLPITVPNGGSATVVGIFTAIPTEVRLMSGEDEISAHNAYIKIKPLGEARYGS